MILSFLALAAGAVTNDALVLDGYVLGCLTNDGWRSYRASAPLPPLMMSSVGIGRLETSAGTATFGETDGVGRAKGIDAFGVFFAGKAWFPREVVEQTRDRYAYLPIAARYAQSFGAKRSVPYIVHVWNVELNKSGQKQEIIEAVSRPETLRGDVQPGDWQAVLLHTRVGGVDRIFALQTSFASGSAPLKQCRLRAIADFEGNGTMEVVTSGDYSFGKSATIWSFEPTGQLKPLMDFSFSVSAAGLGN